MWERLNKGAKGAKGATASISRNGGSFLGNDKRGSLATPKRTSSELIGQGGQWSVALSVVS